LVLLPTLKPDDVVIMDKLRVHKIAAVRQAIEAAGAKLLFIPPYKSRQCSKCPIHQNTAAATHHFPLPLAPTKGGKRKPEAHQIP